MPSPISVSMVEGTANFVTRGKGQQIDLSPYLYSFDPDFPEDKVITLFLMFMIANCYVLFNISYNRSKNINLT